MHHHSLPTLPWLSCAVLVRPFVGSSPPGRATHWSMMPGSPFPTVAPLGIGSPPTHGTMGHSDFCPSLSASSGCPLSADTSRCPCFLCCTRSQRHLTVDNWENWCSGSPSYLHRTIHRGVDRPPRRCPELVEGFLNQPCVHMPRSQTKPVLSLSKGLAR